jgi:type I restriction enzyme, S subunit
MTALPAKWASAMLGEIAEWGSGGTPRAGDSRYYGGEIPWAVIGDLNDGVVGTTAATITEEGLRNSSARVVPRGTVLMAMYGSIGKLGIAGLPLATNQAIVFARPNEAVEARFLFWFLRSQREAFAAAGKGATQKNISQTVIRPWPVPVPPLAEQRRIVRAIDQHFSRLDAAVGQVQRASISARRLRVSLLETVFAEAEPTVALRETADVVSGQTPKGFVPLVNGPTPFYKVGDMNLADGNEMGQSRTYVDDELIDRYRLRVRPAGTVIFPKRGGAIATNKKKLLTVPAAFDLNTMAVVPGKELMPRYLLAWLQTVDLISLADGSNVPQINHDDVTHLRIPVPPRADQERILAQLDEQLSKLDAVEQAMRLVAKRSASLRRVILLRAFAGELVPQDPDDEPASALLERIATERAAAPTPAQKRSDRMSA